MPYCPAQKVPAPTGYQHQVAASGQYTFSLLCCKLLWAHCEVWKSRLNVLDEWMNEIWGLFVIHNPPNSLCQHQVPWCWYPDQYTCQFSQLIRQIKVAADVGRCEGWHWLQSLWSRQSSAIWNLPEHSVLLQYCIMADHNRTQHSSDFMTLFIIYCSFLSIDVLQGSIHLKTELVPSVIHSEDSNIFLLKKCSHKKQPVCQIQEKVVLFNTLEVGSFFGKSAYFTEWVGGGSGMIGRRDESSVLLLCSAEAREEWKAVALIRKKVCCFLWCDRVMRQNF